MRQTFEGGCISGARNICVQIHKCTFWHNHALFGGVLHLEYDVKINIRRANFTGNVASISGGAIHLYTNIVCDCKDTRFSMNAAQTGASICTNEQVKIRIWNSTLYGDMVLNSTLLLVMSATEGSSLYIMRNAEVTVYDTYFVGGYHNVIALVLKYQRNV